MTIAPARKYNPGFLSDEELVVSFCVRTHEFESLVEALSECTGVSNQHQIVIGPRGSGKTSLLLRVAVEVRRNADLAAFFPIVFAEESYEVGTASEFWLECLARLAIQAPEREDAPDLNATLSDLRTIQEDRTLGERCLATLLDFADREGKRLVLMVENLNMMFRDMMDRNAGWRLRKILQTEPRIILLGSATSRFDEIDHPDHALYEQFRVLTLRPLTTGECAVLWETVTGQSRPTNTIRPLEILTGGSPRLLAIVARFGAGRSFGELMDNLLDLVDDHTEYFKSHLESLPAQERRVYLALADLWEPALAKEIAERARLDSSKCSAQLARLVDRGAVLVTGGSARRKQYYLSERMYNIYYLLRRNRGPERVVDVLIQFMAAYYSPDEQKQIGTLIALEAEDTVPKMRSLCQYASAKLLAMLERAHQEGHAASGVGSANDVQVVEAQALLDRGTGLLERSEQELALATFDELLRRFGDTRVPALMEKVGKALVYQGAALGQLNRPDESLAVCEEVLRRFGDSGAQEFGELMAHALVNKGAALGELNRPDEVLVTSDEVLRRFGRREGPGFREQVAQALVNKGTALGQLKRPREALAIASEVLRRFDDSEMSKLPEQVESALVIKGLALNELHRPNEALTAWDDVLRRIGDSVRPNLQERVAMALVQKGLALSALRRPNAELSAYEELLHRFGENDGPEFLGLVAYAFISKGVVLGALGRREEALATYDEVLRRVDDSEVPELLAQAAVALFNKGVTLSELNRWEEALAAYDEFMRRFGANERTPGGPQQAAEALINKNVVLAKLSRPRQPLDAAALLALLPKLDSPRRAIRALMLLSVDFGPARMCELIQASPAVEPLWPLTVALEREMGQDPRVPQEVSEVAEDIRRELATMRKARGQVG